MIDDRYRTAGNIAPHLRESLVAYIETGRPTGDFLYAVLCNDLRESVLRADIENSISLASIVRWLYEYAPAECWHDAKSVAAWMRHDGLKNRPHTQRQPREA